MKTFKEFITEDVVELDEATYHTNKDLYAEILQKLDNITSFIENCIEVEENFRNHQLSPNRDKVYMDKFPKNINKELVRSAVNAIHDHFNNQKDLDEDTILEWAFDSNLLDESFKPGSLKLKDGNTVKISKVDAGLLNSVFGEMSSTNKIKFMKSMENSLKDFNDALLMAKS